MARCNRPRGRRNIEKTSQLRSSPRRFLCPKNQQPDFIAGELPQVYHRSSSSIPMSAIIVSPQYFFAKD